MPIQIHSPRAKTQKKEEKFGGKRKKMKKSEQKQLLTMAATIVAMIISTILVIPPIEAISVEECCRHEGVPDICVRTLCNPGMPPSDFALYDIFERRNNCSRHLSPIAKCLASGRDNYSCCSKEAKDLDENACFGLCRGDGHFMTINSYQTCIALNLGSMFSCIEKGYRKSPSQPRNVNIAQIGATEIELNWHEPEFNAALVDHYLLLISELHPTTDVPIAETELRVETVNKNARITLLEPGTRYLVKVIALGTEETQQQQKRNGLPLVAIRNTLQDGIAPEVKPFRENVQIPLNSDAVVACRIRISGGATRSEPQIRWEFKRSSSNKNHHHNHHTHSHPFQPIKINDRIIHGRYNFSQFRPRELMALLQIKNIKTEDFGSYKCKVADDFGESEAIVQLNLPPNKAEHRATPPETSMECCIRNGVEQRCLSMCGGNENEQKMKYIPRPFMSQNCSGEIAKVLSCAMPKVDDSPCCIIKKLPSQCLYLCDHQIRPSNLMPLICLDYVIAAEECRVRGIQNRPGNVQNLKIVINNDNSFNVTFELSERADKHHIYWRNQKGPWQHNEIIGIGTGRAKLAMPLDEVAVVSENPFGLSQSARMKYAHGKWERA